MNAGELKSMDLMKFCRQDNNYDDYLVPYLVQLVVTTNWTLDWQVGASDKVSDGVFG